MSEYDSICCNCLYDTNGTYPCPSCGSVHTFPMDPSALPLRTLLHKDVVTHKAQYMTGKCLGVGGFGITYLALDMNLNMPVAIKEFFPRNIAMRSRGDTAVYPNTDKYAG